MDTRRALKGGAIIGAVYDGDYTGDDFVICSKCGARIKATRKRCLRCFEPLHVDESQLPIWRTLRISDQTGLLLAVFAAIALMALVWVLWTTADRTSVDAEAKPVEHQNPLIVPPTPQGAPQPSGDAAAPLDVSTATPSSPAAATADTAIDDLAATRHAFEEKLKLDPNDPVALDGLGITLQRMGNMPEALAAFKHATEAAPRNATARVNLARIEAQLGQWDKAVGEYRIAAQLSPDDSEVHYHFALALQQTRDFQGAVAEFETAVQLAPREATAHRGLAASLEALGRNSEAARAYQRYLELSPDAPDAAAIRDRLQRLSKP